MHHNDTLQRFIFEGTPVRGELVNLSASWQAVLERHDYPPAVRDILGELMVAAALLASTIKFKGSLIVQLQGSGPITLMVVECTSDRTLRGLAHWNGDVNPGSLEQVMGTGHLAITIDPEGGMRRYQGIVGLEGENIAQALENYLTQSEQLNTSIWLAASEQTAAGMLLQKLPGETEDQDTWNRIGHLGATITKQELLELSGIEIVRRLFHQEDVRVFESEPLSFRCHCSRDRVGNMLKGLGRHEINEILAEQGTIGVHCEFCNQYYEFDRVDADQLFAAEAPPEVPKTRH